MTIPTSMRPRAAAIHPQRCTCQHCMPRRRSELGQIANRWAGLTIAGVALGVALAWLIDLLVAGPGILSIFLGVN